MVVMASRPNADITAVPPPLTPGRRAAPTTSTGVLANADVTLRARPGQLGDRLGRVHDLGGAVLHAWPGSPSPSCGSAAATRCSLFVLLTMMVPIQLGLIPLYMLMVKLHLDRRPCTAVIVPFLVTGFGVFMMRQYVGAGGARRAASRRPGSTAARRCGSSGTSCCPRAAAGRGGARRCSRSWRRWNDFLWPYLVLDLGPPDRAGRRSSRLAGGYYTDYALIFAGTAARRRCRCSWSSSCSAARSSAASWKVRSRRDHRRAPRRAVADGRRGAS